MRPQTKCTAASTLTHGAFLIIRLDLSNTVKPRSSSYCFCLWLLSCDLMCPAVDTHYCDWLSDFVPMTVFYLASCLLPATLFGLIFTSGPSRTGSLFISLTFSGSILLLHCKKMFVFLFSPKSCCSGSFRLMCYVVLLCRAVTVKLCALFTTIG